jgi:amidase
MTSLPELAGHELARKIREREVSAVEVMTEHLDRIERTNPNVNAIPTLRPRDELLAEARRADEALARGDAVGPLHGIPHAVKDTALTKGLRTTLGSRIFSDLVPEKDAFFVERLRAAGAIVIGKTNVPEFGAGSQTFNEVFGPTRNPYDPAKTPGGSSGGAAAALACGMVPFADGSDLGGSLRNPGSFTNVVGFRPTPGRVAEDAMLAGGMAVIGALGRNVTDVAYLLSVIAGPDERDLHSQALPPSDFLAPLARSFDGARIAWSDDLGLFPVEGVVLDVCRSALTTLEELGCMVEQSHPDFRGAEEAFQTLRAQMFVDGFGPMLAQSRHLMKDTVIWNIEQGLALEPGDVAAAEKSRSALVHRVDAFLQRHEFLCLPVSQVPPFSVEVEGVREVAGVPMRTYLDWMMTCAVITLTGLPAVSVPAGFTPDGLPIGLQIVGRRNADFEVLQLAHAFEQATRHGERRPTFERGDE